MENPISMLTGMLNSKQKDVAPPLILVLPSVYNRLSKLGICLLVRMISGSTLAPSKIILRSLSLLNFKKRI